MPRADKRVLRGIVSTPAGRPRVTVVVTAYNYGRFLPACVESVLSQRDVDVGLIVIDDCSSDDTVHVSARLAAGDTRVTVIRHERNRGHIPSVNEGYALVDTPYVVKLDADDLLAPGALARATALLEAHADVAFVYGRPGHFTDRVPEGADVRARSWTVWRGRSWVAERCRIGTNVISQPEVVMRTSTLRRVLPIPEHLAHTSDLNLWLRLASVGDVGRINGPVQGYYREHAASMQHTVNSGVLVDLRGRLDAFEAAFAAESGALAGAAELRDIARRSVACAALDRACRAYDRGRTDVVPVEEIVAFALEAWPAARELSAWRRLEQRRAAGPDRARRHPRFLAEAVVRRTGEEFGRRRWLRTGEQARSPLFGRP